MSTVLTEQQKKTVVANLALVEHIVNRVAANLPATYSRDDLVQTGTLGLISATVRYDPSAGTAFSTFAGRRIEGAIIDLLRQADWAPRSVRALERRLVAAEQRADQAGAIGPAQVAQRLARDLGVEPEDIERLRGDIDRARIESLDRPVSGEDAAVPLASTVSNGRALTEETVADQEMIGYLRDGVALLPERHRIVVVGYYYEGKSMTELGALLGVTQSRASQLKDEALTLLRNGLDSVYGEGDETVPGEASSRRQRAFTESFASSREWRDRLTAGKGISVVG